MAKRLICSCITLQKELEQTIAKIGFDGKVRYLDVALHSDPQKMHQTLQKIIDDNTEAEEIIICVSGCGKATCDLQASTCNLAVPRTMDCIDVLLTGSGIKRPDGAIFITKSWMNFMKNSSIDYMKLVREQGKDAAEAYLKKLYHGFTDFYIIDTGTYDLNEVEAYIMPLVKLLEGTLTRLPGPYKVLEKLVSGNYDESVIFIPKGGMLSIHEFDGLRPCTIKK
ncbi:DUF1638 domain-containing protein [uncultured Phascolarctobacterium sp.]|uniref:DUF1638 domain-containing protein n=1 Tax=uncultured Phascolarctobacterium sp. TaxID=512296 RepID=UPI0025FBB395|nr:DUF1638 domain-containing protein [uncultured Phascolarctobacterium sp.]